MKIIYFAFLFSLCGWSQGTQSDEKKIYQWFDSETGLENSSLFQGIEYREEHVMITDKHKFFLTSLFQPGTIYYEGQPYYKINLKYNIYDDLIIVRLPKTGGGEETFSLNSEKVESFEIEGHQFLNFATQDGNFIKSGFQQVLFETEQYKLLKDHKRRIFLRRDGTYPYHEFNDPGAEYCVFYEKQYHPIQNRREVIKVFPQYEEEIKRYYKDHRKLQRANPDDFMTGLFKLIDENSLTRT